MKVGGRRNFSIKIICAPQANVQSLCKVRPDWDNQKCLSLPGNQVIARSLTLVKEYRCTFLHMTAYLGMLGFVKSNSE